MLSKGGRDLSKLYLTTFLFKSYFEITFRLSEDLTLPQSSLATFRLLLKRKVQQIYGGRNGKEEEKKSLQVSLLFSCPSLPFTTSQLR